MGERSSIFDMIGPVMIGPSSSHTAGVVRIARSAVKVLGGVPDEAIVTFYNSFARTYEGHGSDKAIVAGLLNYKTDDTRIKQAFELAEEAGLRYTFRSIGSAGTYHPNTIKLNLTKGEKKVEVLGESLGGGVINISKVNGFTANISAALHTLIITADDREGSIAFITSIITHDKGNIATMSVSRKGKKDIACLAIEMDSGLTPITLEYMKNLEWVKNVIYIPDIDM